jgi:hypothetical protein
MKYKKLTLLLFAIYMSHPTLMSVEDATPRTDALTVEDVYKSFKINNLHNLSKYLNDSKQVRMLSSIIIPVYRGEIFSDEEIALVSVLWEKVINYQETSLSKSDEVKSLVRSAIAIVTNLKLIMIYCNASPGERVEEFSKDNPLGRKRLFRKQESHRTALTEFAREAEGYDDVSLRDFLACCETLQNQIIMYSSAKRQLSSADLEDKDPNLKFILDCEDILFRIAAKIVPLVTELKDPLEQPKVSSIQEYERIRELAGYSPLTDERFEPTPAPSTGIHLSMAEFLRDDEALDDHTPRRAAAPAPLARQETIQTLRKKLTSGELSPHDLGSPLVGRRHLPPTAPSDVDRKLKFDVAE